jgi:hypothetical protein
MSSRVILNGRTVLASKTVSMRIAWLKFELVRLWYFKSPIVSCVACGAWLFFWWRAAKRGWKYQTFSDGEAHVLCRVCYREQE